MSPRRCIKCGNVGRVPMASTDGLCVECINERYMSAKRLELRRRGLAAVRLQRRIRGAAARRYAARLRAARDRLRWELLMMSCQRRVAALWRGSRARRMLLMKQRATVIIQCSERCRQARARRKVLFDAWYEGLLKLGDQMFEELADWSRSVSCISPFRGAAAPSRHRRASSPGEEAVGGLFSDFGAVRTVSIHAGRAPTPSACPTAPGRRRPACRLCRN